MRKSGVVTDARGLLPNDHLCWFYDTVPEFRSRAGEFLADGLRQGMRVCYIGDGDTQPLRDGIEDVAGMARALREGSARVLAVDDVFPAGAVADPAGRVRWCAEATDAALADGFDGLWLAFDATALVRDPDRLAAFAGLDQLTDRFLVDHPASLLCGYHRAQLDQQTIARLACLHPGGNTGAAGFRLHAGPAGVTCLAGELDMTSAELLPWALRRAEPPLTGREMVFDAAELTFVDHRGLLALGEYAHSRGATAVLRTGWPGAGRIVTLLNVEDVRVEPPI